MKTFRIRCDFSGSIRYEIEAESKDAALCEAKWLFAEENGEVVRYRVDDTDNAYTVEDEYDTVTI